MVSIPRARRDHRRRRRKTAQQGSTTYLQYFMWASPPAARDCKQNMLKVIGRFFVLGEVIGKGQRKKPFEKILKTNTVNEVAEGGSVG